MIENERRNAIWKANIDYCKQNSTSTKGSTSPRYFEVKSCRINKEKLQLCRTYTEFGYCPYQDKCKFAHGFHQLRKNNTANSKYKTKECVTFIKNGYCHYGSRCNFIHTNEANIDQRVREILPGYVQIFQNVKNGSKIFGGDYK